MQIRQKEDATAKALSSSSSSSLLLSLWVVAVVVAATSFDKAEGNDDEDGGLLLVWVLLASSSISAYCRELSCARCSGWCTIARSLSRTERHEHRIRNSKMPLINVRTNTTRSSNVSSIVYLRGNPLLDHKKITLPYYYICFAQ